ncbi:MAG TPA: DNA translocase FtsK [Phycisphaerales bacterium]|nr:DNA translocase FtsK [Phycisphaerales bacterium]
MARSEAGDRARKRVRKSSSQASDGSGMLAIKRALWLLAATVWVFVALSLISFSSSDAPSHVVAVQNAHVTNLCGRAGAIVSYWGYWVIGTGVWVALICTGVYLVLTVRGERVNQTLLRAIGVVMMSLSFSCLHQLFLPNTGPLVGAPAGLTAHAVMGELLPRFGPVGSFVIVMFALGVGGLLAIEQVVLAIPGATLRAMWLAKKVKLPKVSLPNWKRPELAVEGVGRTKSGGSMTMLRPRRPKSASEKAVIDPDAGGVGAVEQFDPDEHVVKAEEEAETTPSGRPKLTAEELKAKIAQLPVRIGGATQVVARDEDIPREENFEGYKFPTLELLADPESNFSEKMEDYVRSQAQRLEGALQEYGIDGEVAGIESGPVVTLYSVQLAPGTKVAKVTAVSSDIARALSAQNIRIVPNMAGKTTVGIEVPNNNKERVRLKELMSSGHAEKMMLPMFLGKDASGEPLVADLTRMPHMLIAGTTGSGKSVCINTIIMGWLYTKRPDELKLVLVDPKMVELSQFAEIPHLMCPVVTESGKASAILEWAVTKMEERYELLREAEVRDIASYNAMTDEEKYAVFKPENDLERAKIPKKMPYIVFIIDELADLILTNREAEHSIVRIAQKARAVGIHLVLATQRPQANVVTGLIKANMPCRVSFKVASGMDSRIVLDQKGAELLLGQGDMLFLTPQTSEVRRAQGTLVSSEEARRVVNFMKTVATPNFERSLLTLRSITDDGEGNDEGVSPHERDPMFDDAVKIMIESGRGSVSLLQRRLAIGYTRASRLVDQMGRAGILGDHKGSVAREVIITMEEWEEMKRLEAEAEKSGTVFERPMDEQLREEDEALGETGESPFEADDERHMPEVRTVKRKGSRGDDEDDDAGVPAEFDGEFRQ